VTARAGIGSEGEVKSGFGGSAILLMVLSLPPPLPLVLLVLFEDEGVAVAFVEDCLDWNEDTDDATRLG
jgi:hypothetical protein